MQCIFIWIQHQIYICSLASSSNNYLIPSPHISSPLASPQLLASPPLDGARGVAGDVAPRHQLLLLLGLHGGGDPVEAVGKHRHGRLYLVDESLE